LDARRARRGIIGVMARKKVKKKRPAAPVPLERMQQLWQLGAKVVPSRRGYTRKAKHKPADPAD
jgi:hypothetical protein